MKVFSIFVYLILASVALAEHGVTPPAPLRAVGVNSLSGLQASLEKFPNSLQLQNFIPLLRELQTVSDQFTAARGYNEYDQAELDRTRELISTLIRKLTLGLTCGDAKTLDEYKLEGIRRVLRQVQDFHGKNPNYNNYSWHRIFSTATHYLDGVCGATDQLVPGSKPAAPPTGGESCADEASRSFTLLGASVYCATPASLADHFQGSIAPASFVNFGRGISRTGVNLCYDRAVTALRQKPASDRAGNFGGACVSSCLRKIDESCYLPAGRTETQDNDLAKPCGEWAIKHFDVNNAEQYQHFCVGHATLERQGVDCLPHAVNVATRVAGGPTQRACYQACNVSMRTICHDATYKPRAR